MEIAHTVTASPLNPLGIKGAGEAGGPCRPAVRPSHRECARLWGKEDRTQRNSIEPETAVRAERQTAVIWTLAPTASG